MGYPLLALLFGEVAERLQRRGNALQGAVRFLRNIALPCGVALVLLREVLGRSEDDLSYRVLLPFTLASLLLRERTPRIPGFGLDTSESCPNSVIVGE